jgi:hypothetical protein
MPAQAANFHIAREEDSNPPRLERGETWGSTRARDHFQPAPVAEQTTGIRLLNGTTQVQLLPGAPFPDDVKAACPSVKRVVVVQVHVGEPIHGARPVGRGRCLENSRTFTGAQGSNPWRSAIFSPDRSKVERPAHIRQTGVHYLVRRPSSFLRSSKAEPPPDQWKTAARYRAEEPSAV